MMLTLLILLSSTGCSTKTVLDPQKPVTLTMWHNYGGQMKNLMDEMIDEFNRTVGADQGIIINVTSISGSSALHDKLISAAYGDPGAPEFPDLAVVYPKTALKLAEKDLLADLSDRFTGEELSAYVPRFVEEGKIKGGLFVFPIAKSTEVLFVNRSIFDRFAADTGAAYDDLSTFEGIIRTADKYYEWSEGKAFYMPDSVFNLALIGMAQLGEDFVQENRLNMASGEYKKIWDGYFLSAVKGSTAIFDGYSTDLFKTGDVICSTGSTAGTLFYPDTVTYTDNTKENAEYAILPYPVFEGGKKVALQRGGGMCVIKSSGQKEIAAAVFLKWFTAPEQNLHFTASSGYLPVTEEAFGNAMSRQMEGISEENIKKLLSTAMVMQEEYDFFIPPLTDNYDELQKGYEARLKKAAKAAKAEFDALAGAADKAAALETLSKNVYEDFIK
jgi:multiple sugar transport system substrate-binding protein